MIRATSDELRTAVAGQWKMGQRPTAPISGVGTDSREDLAGRLFVALRGDRHDGHAFLQAAALRGAVAALVDRKGAPSAGRATGMDGTATGGQASPLPLLEVADTRVALLDLARFWRSRLRAKVVAITGSSGKTTTRRLIDAALATTMKGTASPKSFNNEIGVPLTVLAAAADDQYLVAEIGMSHAGEIAPLARAVAPHIAVITMTGRAHIGGMGSEEAIVAEKATLVDGLHTSGMAIVNGDQPALLDAVRARAKPGVRVVPFGCGADCQWRLDSRRALGETQHMRVVEPDGQAWECSLGLAGAYNAMNALAAAACARALGVPASAVAAACAAVRPAEMRMTRQSVGGFTLINDAYNSNPDAVLAALAAFAEVAAGASAPRRVAVLGDMLELGGPERVAALHAEIGRAVAASGTDVAIFVGEGSAHGHAAAAAAGARSHHYAELTPPSLQAIAEHLRPGDWILVKGSRGSRMERLIAALEARGGVAHPCSTT